jgi:hypothetical protein
MNEESAAHFSLVPPNAFLGLWALVEFQQVFIGASNGYMQESGRLH